MLVTGVGGREDAAEPVCDRLTVVRGAGWLVGVSTGGPCVAVAVGGRAVGSVTRTAANTRNAVVPIEDAAAADTRYRPMVPLLVLRSAYVALVTIARQVGAHGRGRGDGIAPRMAGSRAAVRLLDQAGFAEEVLPRLPADN